MRSAQVIALVLACVPQVASAGADGPFDYHLRLCDDCGLAGSLTRGRSPVWVEGGVDVLHFVPATTNLPIDVVGGDVRVLARNGRYHVGFEFAFADLGSQLPMTTARTTGGEPMVGPAEGDVAQSKLLLGTRSNFGPVTLLGEVAGGLQVALYDALQRPPSQMWLLLEAHAQANVWLSPKLTLGALAALDVVDPHIAQLTLVVGYHLAPYDGTRD